MSGYFPTSIRKLLSPGDSIFLIDGSEKKVVKVCNLGFYTDDFYYLYSDHRTLYFLTFYGLRKFKEGN